MRDYVAVTYNEKDKPFGEYPIKLGGYLVRRLGMKTGETILDNGCGRGEYIHAFKSYGLKAYGTDSSSFCTDAEIVDLNEEKLPFNDNTFDYVFTKSVIEHISNLDNFLSEIYRVLKPGGKVIIMTPNWRTTYKLFYNDFTHVHPFTEKSIQQAMAIYGFNNIQSEEFVQLPSTWNNGVMNFFSKCIKLIFGPIKKIHKNKFFRFSRETMILGVGEK